MSKAKKALSIFTLIFVYSLFMWLMPITNGEGDYVWYEHVLYAHIFVAFLIAVIVATIWAIETLID